MMILEQDISPTIVPCPPAASLFAEAEKELSAFLAAVAQVHGPHHVTAAAKHWIYALDDAHLTDAASEECFRRVTYSAVVSLCH